MEELAAKAFRRHYGHVYRFVRRRSPSEAEAEDVTAEVFADAAAALDRFEPGAPPVLAWLYTVARRRLVDQARRRARHPELVTQSSESTTGPSSFSTPRAASVCWRPHVR